MEIVLIDKFIVPDESKAEFLTAVHKSGTATENELTTYGYGLASYVRSCSV